MRVLSYFNELEEDKLAYLNAFKGKVFESLVEEAKQRCFTRMAGSHIVIDKKLMFFREVDEQCGVQFFLFLVR